MGEDAFTSPAEAEEKVVIEHQIDISDLKVQHNWVERGAVVSCEGAGHPNHRHFLVNKGSSV